MASITETNTMGLPLGRRIVAARKKDCISQLELSLRTGITRDQISRIELGKCSPKLKTIRKIEICLGLPEWMLLTGETKYYAGLETPDSERNKIYRQIINEFENYELTIAQLRIVGNAAISFAKSIKN